MMHLLPPQSMIGGRRSGGVASRGPSCRGVLASGLVQRHAGPCGHNTTTIRRDTTIIKTTTRTTTMVTGVTTWTVITPTTMEIRVMGRRGIQGGRSKEDGEAPVVIDGWTGKTIGARTRIPKARAMRRTIVHRGSGGITAMRGPVAPRVRGHTVAKAGADHLLLRFKMSPRRCRNPLTLCWRCRWKSSRCPKSTLQRSLAKKVRRSDKSAMRQEHMLMHVTSQPTLARSKYWAPLTPLRPREKKSRR
mmetsp:Transcript_112376/g.223296  ORF Transcript_112376/g.223296 Transcript_112376/m.223296 type:complete len:247 (-) Transcript_112376:1318-2058(-)